MTSATTTTLSRIPTDIYLMDYSKFIQKYWWLRSPFTDWDGYAFLVGPSGGVVDYVYGSVTYSYGRSSPVRNVTYIYAYSVNSNGNAGNNITDISNSYGTLRTLIMYIHGSLV